jgi:hypothetical protein
MHSFPYTTGGNKKMDVVYTLFYSRDMQRLKHYVNCGPLGSATMRNISLHHHENLNSHSSFALSETADFSSMRKFMTSHFSQKLLII